MREILFKAKLKDWQTNPKHNKWVEGFYCNKQETTYCFESDYEKFPVKTQHYIIQERMLDWGLPNEFRLIENNENISDNPLAINYKELEEEKFKDMKGI